MNSVEYDTNQYLARQEALERDWDLAYKDALADLRTGEYFQVSLDTMLDLATREEIVSFYTRSANVQSLWSDDVNEIADGLMNVCEALKLKETRKTINIGTDIYVTEQGFPFIPSRIMPTLRKEEAARRADA